MTEGASSVDPKATPTGKRFLGWAGIVVAVGTFLAAIGNQGKAVADSFEWVVEKLHGKATGEINSMQDVIDATTRRK